MATNTRQRTPQGEARAEAQRERILVAAQRCFIEIGLNSTSVANIAEAAEMSPGLIYRYFESKAEITRAVIRRQLTTTLERHKTERETPDIAKDLTEAFARPHDPLLDELHPVFLLEITAEATRDPVIAEAFKEYEEALRGSFHRGMSRSKAEGGHGIPEELVAERGLVIELLYEGLKMRQVHSPDLDRDLLLRALTRVVKCVLKS
ncbi:TetR/AcrR family transcriptional regulator [Xanthomonas hyacinthi]|nr:TetR/AcrR family transcriptional regulator [Xanthomonas hyacinthi]